MKYKALDRSNYGSNIDVYTISALFCKIANSTDIKDNSERNRCTLNILSNILQSSNKVSISPKIVVAFSKAIENHINEVIVEKNISDIVNEAMNSKYSEFLDSFDAYKQYVKCIVTDRTIEDKMLALGYINTRYFISSDEKKLEEEAGILGFSLDSNEAWAYSQMTRYAISDGCSSSYRPISLSEARVYSIDNHCNFVKKSLDECNKFNKEIENRQKEIDLILTTFKDQYNICASLINGNEAANVAIKNTSNILMSLTKDSSNNINVESNILELACNKVKKYTDEARTGSINLGNLVSEIQIALENEGASKQNVDIDFAYKTFNDFFTFKQSHEMTKRIIFANDYYFWNTIDKNISGNLFNFVKNCQGGSALSKNLDIRFDKLHLMKSDGCNSHALYIN